MLRKLMTWLLTIIVVLAVGLLAAGQFGLLSGRAPADLGVKDGRLKAPSGTPNSVTSQAGLHAGHPMQAYATIDPLPLKGTAPETMKRLAAIVGGMPGAAIVTQRDDYLYAQFTTRWLRFVDDVEFWADPAANVVQVRSASRVGRKDFGVNRARVEAVRAALAGGG